MACSNFSFRVIVRAPFGATSGSITVDRFTGAGPFQVSIDNGLFTAWEDVVGNIFVKGGLDNGGFGNKGYNVRVKNNEPGCGMAPSKGNFYLNQLSCASGQWYYEFSYIDGLISNGASACLITTPLWEDTGNFRCVQINGKNSGHQEKEQRDNNSNSATYLQTRWISNGLNLAACPLPNGNTGFKAWTTLEQYFPDTNHLTGVTKPNVPGDPNYVPPVQDLGACPLN